MKLKLFIIVLFFALFFILPSSAESMIVINEILADPAGDANQDGEISIFHDEFIELLNISDNSIDISGWFITDAVKKRHIFPKDTIILKNDYLVIFGGGNPSLTNTHWQISSTKSLGLNNGGDTVALFHSDSSLIDQVIYGSLANNNQSLIRQPEGIGTKFILHSKAQKGILFSPGRPNDRKFPLRSTVPEPISVFTFGISSLAIFFKHKKSYASKLKLTNRR